MSRGTGTDADRPAVRVGYQGEPGAFSEEAATRALPGAVLVPCRTFRAVFDGVTAGDLERGVVPLENSQSGSVAETYDLLARGGIAVIGEVVVPVDHALLVLPGTPAGDVRRVLSHPQALAQCDEFVAGMGAEPVPVYDTAGAAKQVAGDGRRDQAALASERAAAAYGLEVLARSVQTHGDNRTRFAVIAGEGERPLGPPDKTSLAFVARHVPGALVRCLRPFSDRGLNLTKIESRPLGDRPWEYRFHVDVEAGAAEPALQEALEELEAEASWLRVLGSYPRFRPGPEPGGGG